MRDISVSSIEGFSNSSNRRLLKLRLTDGHNEITAIEYSHVPSIPNDIVPGSKVIYHFFLFSYHFLMFNSINALGRFGWIIKLQYITVLYV